MDFGAYIFYTVSIGGGVLMGASANVLLAAATRGKAYMMQMRDREHIPAALAGALAGLAFAYAATQPHTRAPAAYYQQPGLEMPNTPPRNEPQVVATLGRLAK